MPVDLLSETVLDLDGAVEFASKGAAKKIHKSTIPRWMFRGVRGIRLEYARMGRRLVTSAEAIARFSQSLADADQPVEAPAPPARRPSPSRRQKQIEQAEAYCTSKGI